MCMLEVITSSYNSQNKLLHKQRNITTTLIFYFWLLCGLVARVLGYRSRGPGSIRGTTRFFLRSSGSGTGFDQ
jgi:hypothetical protein